MHPRFGSAWAGRRGRSPPTPPAGSHTAGLCVFVRGVPMAQVRPQFSSRCGAGAVPPNCCPPFCRRTFGRRGPPRQSRRAGGGARRRHPSGTALSIGRPHRDRCRALKIPPKPCPDRSFGSQVSPKPCPDRSFGSQVSPKPCPDRSFGSQASPKPCPDRSFGSQASPEATSAPIATALARFDSENRVYTASLTALAGPAPSWAGSCGGRR